MRDREVPAATALPRTTRPALLSPGFDAKRIVATLSENLIRLVLLALMAGIAFCAGQNFIGGRQLAARAETRAQTVETLALSSVAASVPGRGAARRAQALAIIEALRMGIDISIASVGSGGRHNADANGDAQAFARLAQRFPETIRAAEDRGSLRKRLSKTWAIGSRNRGRGDSYNGSSEVIADPLGRVGACVVELHAPGVGLRAMLTMAYAKSAINAIERKARSLGIAAADVAFLVAAHESSHCVIGMARRAGLLDTAWADPAWRVPPSWAESRSEDDHDSPALAKAEESAADLLAVLWAADALGERKARNLAHLAIYARTLAARLPIDDRLHDSARSLAKFLALSKAGRTYAAGERARFAWNTAVTETRAEIVAASAQRKTPVRR